jgi:hypothetical protein
MCLSQAAISCKPRVLTSLPQSAPPGHERGIAPPGYGRGSRSAGLSLMEEAVTLARVLRGLLRLWPVRSAPHPHLCLRQSDIVAVHSPATTSIDKPPFCILRTFDLRARSAWNSHNLARRPEAQPHLCSRLRTTLCPANPDGVQQPPSLLGRSHCRRFSSLSDVSVVPGR